MWWCFHIQQVVIQEFLTGRVRNVLVCNSRAAECAMWRGEKETSLGVGVPGGVLWRGGSHLGADGSGVGVNLGGPPSTALPQQGAADEGKRHGQCRVLIVRGHVGDALAAVAHLVSGSDVEGRVVGGAGGAETTLPCGRFGQCLGGSGRLRRRHGQWCDDRAIQGSDAAGVAGKVLLRDGGAVRPILLTAVVLERGTAQRLIPLVMSTCIIYYNIANWLDPKKKTALKYQISTFLSNRPGSVFCQAKTSLAFCKAC